MKPTSFLHINNIAIVPFNDSYITEDYLNWMNDKDVVEFTSHINKKYFIDDLKTFFVNVDWKSKFFFAIIDLEKSLHIGNCSLNDVNYDHLVFDMGVLVGNKNYWGGNTTEYVVAMLMHYAFSVLNMRRFFGGCISGHLKTIFIMKKMQFVLSYIQKEAFIYNGKIVNNIQFTMDKKLWSSKEKKYMITRKPLSYLTKELHENT